MSDRKANFRIKRAISSYHFLHDALIQKLMRMDAAQASGNVSREERAARHTALEAVMHEANASFAHFLEANNALVAIFDGNYSSADAVERASKSIAEKRQGRSQGNSVSWNGELRVDDEFELMVDGTRLSLRAVNELRQELQLVEEMRLEWLRRRGGDSGDEEE